MSKGDGYRADKEKFRTVKKILITGASGMLGESLIKSVANPELLKGRRDLDLQDLNATKRWFRDKQYDIIIHLAASTNLKLAESDKKGTYCLQTDVNKVFLEHCKKLIYVSTVPLWLKEGYTKTVYFDSKKRGEDIVLSRDNNAVLRTNIVGSGGLVGWATEELLNNRKINGFSNSWFNPIHVNQASEQIRIIIEKNKSGLIEAFGDITVSKYNFLRQVAAKKSLRQDLIVETNLDKTQDLVWNVEGSNLSYNKCMELI